MITVQEAAAELGRPASTVKYWCRQHDIGLLVTPRLRLLAAEDLQALRRLAATVQRGNPGPRDQSGKFSGAQKRRAKRPVGRK